MKPWIRNVLFSGPDTHSKTVDFGLLIARVGFGLLMAFGHGLSKLWSDGSFGPPAGFVQGVGNLGFPIPIFFAWSAGIAEFVAALLVAALLVAAGLLTRPMALVLVFNMSVAAFGQHLNDPIFAKSPPSKELALLYLIPFLSLLFTGAGRFSADRLIRGR